MRYLYFSSQHCAPCMLLKPKIMKYQEIAIIDIDKQSGMATKYGVMSIPVLLILNDDDSVEEQIQGNKINKFLKENFKK